MSIEESKINSSDYRVKVIEMLQQNWALIEPSPKGDCMIYFYFRRNHLFIKKHRKVGYKNFVKLLLNESTPEKLKGEAG